MPALSLTWTTFSDDQRHLVVQLSGGAKEPLCGFRGRSVAAHLPCVTCMDQLFRAHDDAISTRLSPPL